MSDAGIVITRKIDELSERIKDKTADQHKLVEAFKAYVSAADDRDIVGPCRSMIANIEYAQKEINSLCEWIRVLVWIRKEIEE